MGRHASEMEKKYEPGQGRRKGDELGTEESGVKGAAGKGEPKGGGAKG